MRIVGSAEREVVDRIVDILERASKSLQVDLEEVIIHLGEDHNEVRDILGLPRQEDHTPIKLILDDEIILSIVVRDVVKLSPGRMELMILRELATVRVMNEPELISMWTLSSNEPLAKLTSLAMMRRVIDYVISTSTAIHVLIDNYEEEEFIESLNCGVSRHCAIYALALDVPLSIEVAGHPAGISLWNRVRRRAASRLVNVYDDLRSFVRNNFNAESAYNYITMMIDQLSSASREDQ